MKQERFPSPVSRNSERDGWKNFWVSEVHNGELYSAGHVQFGFAGKGLWEVLDARRAGAAYKGVVPVEQPYPLADVRYYGRLRRWAIRDGVFLAMREQPAAVRR